MQTLPKPLKRPTRESREPASRPAKRPARAAAAAPGALAPVLQDEPVSTCPTKVYNKILQGIFEGRYVPGQRLIEADLTRELKVSRGPVREALNQLAAQGIISLTMHRGAYVRSLTQPEVFDILALIEVLIGLAAKLAAENIDAPGARADLEMNFNALMALEDRPDRYNFAQARDSFYRSLVRIGRNRDLARVLPSMQINLVRIQLMAYNSDSQYLRFEHFRQIVNAVVAGKVREAEAAGRRHIQHVRKTVGKLPERAFGIG